MLTAVFFILKQHKIMNNIKIIAFLLIILQSLAIPAQTRKSISYQEAAHLVGMKWTCPEIEKYQNMLVSAQDNDYKIYANNVKKIFGIFTNPSSPKDKYILIQAILSTENPLFSTDNMLEYLANWIKKQKGWSKNQEIDKENKSVTSDGDAINIANYANFITLYKVTISPTLNIQITDNSLVISLGVATYKDSEYDSNNRLARTYTVNISDVYPFVEKSTHKITYSKAYIGTCQYFWDFISNLRQDLNSNYSKDLKLLTQLRYEYSKDSIEAKYGTPTNIITGLSNTKDINSEIHFYENAQKVLFLGKTVNFQDIMSCDITDDPQFIPGRSTTYGAGLSFFGIGIGGSETVSTPGKTLHNYVVNVKIDNLSTPYFHIVMGQNANKAQEIASAFEYIIRHHYNNKSTNTRQKRRRR